MRVPGLSPFWTLQLAGWSAFYVAMSFSRVGRFPLTFMLVDKLPLTLLGVLASLSLRAILRPLLQRQASLPVVVTTCVASSYVLTAIWTALFNLISAPIGNAMLGADWTIDSIGALFGGTVYHAFALTAWGFLYIGIRHYRAWQSAREDALRAETLATEARLRALQSQLNPHFFFNALNAISTLVAERRNDDASAMIARLGDLLRSTFAREGAATVSLAEELELVQRYLEIERVRFAERLRVRLDVAEDAYDAAVPLLLLQPLVENAIRHGIAAAREGGDVSLIARVEDRGAQRWLSIVIENSAPAVSVERPGGETNGNGVGLANVRERLSMIHGSNHDFSAGWVDGGRYRVRIALPLSTATRTVPS
ncbi:MAG TPA: histidine kinase [Gemmatimonadaceae bacterium]